MKTFAITENDAEQRLDKFLSKSVPLLPKSLLYKSIRTKRIKVNGKRTELNYRLVCGDRVDLYLNDEFFIPHDNLPFLQVTAQIDVVYEDSLLLLVNKPQGLVVHEDNENTVDTLINRVLHYLYKKGDYRPDEESSFIPALCNRIDRNTCGIVMVAKTAAALRLMNEKIKERAVEKRYLCLVLGTPEPREATLRHYLEKRTDSNLVQVYDRPNANTKTAITSYRVLESRNGLSLLDIELHTGRTHQIRAQMAHMGHPLLGDGKYGNGKINKQHGYYRQLLCSYQLTLHFSEEECLSYLDNKTFTLSDIWFVEKFRTGSI